MTVWNEKMQEASGNLAVPIAETSIRYDGWRIIVVCFLVATFGWGFGFYGQSVYLAELHRARGWPTSLLSGATTFFYLFGAVIVAFVAEAIRRVGPRNCLLAGILALAVAAVAIGAARAPWQLYAANALLAFGWAGTSLAMITTTLSLWFDQRRGMAISLALNGASFGGIAGVPLLVAAIGHFGFSRAMTIAALTMVALLLPVVLLLVGAPPRHRGATKAARGDAPAPSRPRMRRRRRRSVPAPFAISASSRCRRRSRWCCSRRSASSST
jgi:MFS family permease